MKQNRDCKIVQDLLPNYIENLTDEVTNEYIEDHIATCPECARVLKDMDGEIKLEQINQDKEIKYLKAVRKRVKRTIAIVSLVVIVIASCIIGYVYKRSKLQINNYTFMRASYLTEDKELTRDGKLYGTLIAVFDERGICVSMRVVEEGYTDEAINNIKSNFMTNFFTNLKYDQDSIHYNINTWNGWTKEKVKQDLIQNYKIESIEEI